jgi:hypothetical protein
MLHLQFTENVYNSKGQRNVYNAEEARNMGFKKSKCRNEIALVRRTNQAADWMTEE